MTILIFQLWILLGSLVHSQGQTCPEGKYGRDCNFTCSQFCVIDGSTKTCDQVNGTCLLGCQDGYYGDTCDSECPKGTYGKECKSNCSQYCVTDQAGTPVCDNTNGTCYEGCQDGYTTSWCNKSCPAGTFGKDCLSDCSQFCVTGSSVPLICEHVNGACLNGCKDGYMPPLCNQTCPVGKFGKDCKTGCSPTCVVDSGGNVPCDYINGTCTLGCQDGYISSLCNELSVTPNDRTFPSGWNIFEFVLLGLMVAGCAAAYAPIVWEKIRKKMRQIKEKIKAVL